jgi:hypothetical protein
MPEQARPGRRSRPYAALAAAVAVALFIAPRAALAQFSSLAQMPLKRARSSDGERALGTLRDPSAPAASRMDAARELARTDSPDVRAQVLEMFEPASDADARRLLVTAAADVVTTDPWLVPALGGLIAGPAPGSPADETEQARAVSALGAIRARESAQVLVRVLCCAESAERRDAVQTALIRCTGHADVAPDCRAWTEWLSRAMLAPELDWMRTEAEAQAGRADALSRQLASTTARIVDVLRRSYIDPAGAEERAKLLMTWLGDDLPEVRRLGVELINRELANARQVDPKVARAALGLLADPVPDLRARAAELAFSLGPDGAGDAVCRALLSETDALVASSLLRAAARWPSPMITDVVLEWSELDAEAATRAAPGAARAARRAALEAAAALSASDKLSPAGASRILGVLRTLPDADLTGAACTLLTRLGSDQDRARVVAMLKSPTLKTPAADGLAADARGVPVLLAAAATDPALFTLCARAVTRWSPSAESFARVAGLPAPTPEAQRDGLLQLAAALDPDDLLAAARSSGDLSLREALLARLAAAPTTKRPWSSGAAGADPALAAGLLLLAQTRLDLGQPSGAIAALEALSAVPNSVDPSVRSSMLTVALLWLNRIDEAASTGSGPEAWIEGLRRAATQPHAREIVAAIRSRFGATLTHEQSARLADIESKLPRPR